MKHNIKITLLLLAMFIATQFIGIYVVNYYTAEDKTLPFGFETPKPTEPSEFNQVLVSIIFAFVIAISLLFLLTKFRAEIILKVWFFIVITIALSITFGSLLPEIQYKSFIALAIALPLVFMKTFKRYFLVHNATELLIYPGIASVFVPILNIWTIIILLILISAYDIWAVWHSGIMQKMAKYQIDKLKVFSGFFVPYLSKKVRMKMKDMKKNLSKSELKKKKIKVSVAILGGGDIVFPIITSGVVLKTQALALPFGLKPFTGGFVPALFVVAGATLGLAYLFFFAKKKKFYPAMPFITAGIFAGILVSYLIF